MRQASRSISDVGARMESAPPPAGFTKENTFFCKGIAVLMLLAHHLWSVPRPDVYPEWLSLIAQQCKVCVAIFVFLSGFGLVRAGCDWRKMLLARIPRLFLNYWIVAFIFLSIGFVFFEMSFKAAYPDGRYWIFVLQMFGVNFVAPYGGFNPTWWYMNAAVPFYFAAPLVFWQIKRMPFLGLIIVCLLSLRESGHFVFWVYMSTFYAGMMAAMYNWLEWILADKRALICVMVLTPVLFFVRRYCGLLIDGYLAFVIIVILFLLYRGMGKCRGGPIVFLGIHSMNIFFVHTFFQSYWFPSFFKSTSAWLSFPILLLASLACSFSIEYAKKVVNFGKIDRCLIK